MTHELKILPEYFRDVKKGLKTAEIRLDDRDYMPGDVLILSEWKPKKKEFTGREVTKQVASITRLSRVIPGLPDHRWVVLHMVDSL